MGPARQGDRRGCARRRARVPLLLLGARDHRPSRRRAGARVGLGGRRRRRFPGRRNDDCARLDHRKRRGAVRVGALVARPHRHRSVSLVQLRPAARASPRSRCSVADCASPAPESASSGGIRRCGADRAPRRHRSGRLGAHPRRRPGRPPGNVFLGLGLEALHVFTTYFLETKLANASDLYGVLGLATTALFYLFLVGRGVVWAAELNAVVWEVLSRRR